MDILTLLLPGPEGARPYQPVRVIGIDLGTTNSTVAEIVYDPRAGGPPTVRCLEIDQSTAQGSYTHVLVPSVVAVQPQGPLVGEGAKRLRGIASERNLEQNRDLFWECKNDMGLRRTYHRAPPGFCSAREIAGHVLAFLSEAARRHNEQPIDRMVVTVPASFQTAQRRDTLEAARLAGLELVGGDLLDEPVAAFLDQLFTAGLDTFVRPGQAQNLLVFDFGGGTCDVAILRVQQPAAGGPPHIAPLAVSRYHRLGGGDIDAAIVYEVLLRQLLKQNQREQHDLSFTDKKRWIEPAFLAVAEALKIGLSGEIARLKQFGKYPGADRKQVLKKLPGVYQCQLPDGRVLRLQSPTLDAEQFEQLLRPFLDRELLYAQETEYRITCSIFAPLDDALDRAGLRREDVQLCLLVGGSSLPVQVREAIADFFPKARQLVPGGPDAVQTAVARGAAYHALALALAGRGLVQPVAADRIAIRTTADDGTLRLVELIPRHAPLPYPQDARWAEVHELTVPQSSDREPVDLRIELVDSNNNLLNGCVWHVRPPVRQGAPLLLRYRMDENQLFEFTLNLATGRSNERFDATIENPLTNVVNPQKQREKIDEMEENLRTGQVPRQGQADALAQLAQLYQEIGQRERALDLLRRALRARGHPDPNLLNRMGILCVALRDSTRAEQFYREAAKHGSCGAPLFNLALHFKDNGQTDRALAAVNEAIELEQDAPYFVLRAQLAALLQQEPVRNQSLEEAFRLFDAPEDLSDWALGWFQTAAQMAGDAGREAKAQAVRRKRKGPGRQDTGVGGRLPDYQPGKGGKTS